MSQTFHVLLCVVCKSFQVQIVKKSSNKWNCKVCDSKQSVQQVYAKGTAPECRNIVQRLNAARGKREEDLANKSLDSVAQAEQEDCVYYPDDRVDYHDDQAGSTFTCESQQVSTTLHNNNSKPGIPTVPPEQSKWTVFLDDN